MNGPKRPTWTYWFELLLTVMNERMQLYSSTDSVRIDNIQKIRKGRRNEKKQGERSEKEKKEEKKSEKKK